ncbi:MAG: universal stress protein [Candidatus Chlorobium antarcticum]|jgi:nucleotide-binding universal stress UspA family protein|nr:universal stress protein [Candidatus Chlorobium antarcticum]
MKPQEKRILAPVDFSADSLHTIRYLAEHHSTGTRLTVLHVVPDEVQGDPDAMLREHLLIFSRYSGILADSGCDVRFAVAYGKPSKMILENARNGGAGMIVLGSHGSSRLLRLLVGSTTESVMRNSPCPVLVLKTPELEEEEDDCPEEDGRETINA